MSSAGYTLDGGLWWHIGGKKAYTLPGSRAAWPVGAREADKAEELEKRLRGGSDSYAANRLLGYRTACGTYLGRLASKHPERMSRRTLEGHTLWTVNPPKPVGR